MNLELYKKNTDAFYSHHHKQTEETEEDYEINVIETKDGNKTLQVSRNGKKVFIHSKYYPTKETEREIDAIEIKRDSIIIMFGLGMAYQAKEVYKRMTSANKLLIVETERKIFDLCMANVDCADFLCDERVMLLITKNDLVIKTAVEEFIPVAATKRIILNIMPSYINIFSDIQADIIKFLKEICYRRNKNASLIDFMGDLWQKREAMNLYHLVKSHAFNDLLGRFHKKPAIIVSAGPSLDKNIDYLKGIEDNALILTVDTAYKALYNKGIKSHLMFTLDSQWFVYNKVKDTDFYDTPMVYLPVSNSRVVGEHKAAKFLSFSHASYFSTLCQNRGLDFGMSGQGGSVACMAFYTALIMGSDPIIFVGQDLAHTDGKGHASSTAYGEGEENKPYYASELEVEDINGGIVKTDGAMILFLYWFQDAIKAVDGERIIIDATEGGAKIRGTQILTLKETLDKYCVNSFYPDKVIQQIHEKGPFLNYEQQKEIISIYATTLTKLKEANEIAVSAIELCNKLKKMTSYGTTNDKTLGKQMTKLKEIDAEISKYDEYINVLGASFNKRNSGGVDIIDEDFEELEQSELVAKIAEESIKFYKALNETIEHLLPVYEEHVPKAEAAILEEEIHG